MMPKGDLDGWREALSQALSESGLTHRLTLARGLRQHSMPSVTGSATAEAAQTHNSAVRESIADALAGSRRRSSSVEPRAETRPDSSVRQLGRRCSVGPQEFERGGFVQSTQSTAHHL